MQLTPQQVAEVGFWRRCFQEEEEGNGGRWLTRRESDYRETAKWFQPTLDKQEGLGLDLGCGMTSILRFRRFPIVAVDPLLDEYRKIFEDPAGADEVEYRCESGEQLSVSAEAFDFVWCINVIDHTPDPNRMAAEIYRVLKPGGKLYFSVNFDPELYAPHYHLWTREDVDHALMSFKMLEGTERWFPEYQKYVFTGIFSK
jgi:SAM-dependent methyltransferase